ncbi:MAG: thioredoxin family protein [Dehalococcoidia bacterium]|nr:thioredoxin family protein [Dehalococcoidia bacterium]
MSTATASQAIDFSLPATDGKTYGLGDIAGEKGTAVIFTCNHCPYVRAWDDRMVALGREFMAQGIGFGAIGSNDPAQYPTDDFAHMKERVQELGMPYPYMHDESQEVARAYGAERTPEIFLFDAAGKLHYHGAVDDSYEDESAVQSTYFRDALAAVVGGDRVPVADTAPVGCTIKWK